MIPSIMIRGFTFILMLLILTDLKASTSDKIWGIVEDNDHHPLSAVTVVMGNNELSTISDDNGRFEFMDIIFPTKLEFIIVGYNRKMVDITSQNYNSEKGLSIILDKNEVKLDEVQVTANVSNKGYLNNYATLGGKLTGSIQDLPQSVSVVGKQLILDKQAFQVSDIIPAISGVTQTSSYDDVTIRGFKSGYENGVRLINGLRSGYGYGTSYFRSPLTVNLESIEVLKGPGASLFGDIAPGGTINMVTKKPLADNFGRINLSVGSYNTIRNTIDLGGPLNNNKTILYRLNIGYEYTNTFRDINTRKDFIIAPSFTFKPQRGTQINLDFVYDHFDGYLDRGIVIKGQDLYALPRSFTLSQPSDFFKTTTISLSGHLTQRILDNLAFHVNYMKSIYKEDLSEHRTLNTYADPPKNTIMNMRFLQRKAKDYTDNAVAYLKWEQMANSLDNNITLGVDYGQYRGAKDNQQKESRSMNVNGEIVPLTFDLNNPVYANQDLNSYIWRAQASFPFISPNKNIGVYVMDQLNLAQKVNIIVGLRHEYYHSESADPNDYYKASQNVWLPRVGATYSINKKINYFASYTQGYIPVAANYVTRHSDYGSDKPFKSENSHQLETGFKTSFLDNKLGIDLSLFHIGRENMMVATGDISDNGLPQYRQSGKVISDGLELDVKGEFIKNLLVDANYTFNHTKVKSSSILSEVGLALPGAPKNTVNIWLKYNFTNTILNGLGLGIGTYYIDARRMDNAVGKNEEGNSIWHNWPSYTKVDAAIYYQLKELNIAININNLFDKYYFLGGLDYTRAFPGAPRNFMVSLSYTFHKN